LEAKRKKKKFTLKKVKKALINLVKKIANQINKLYKQFMSLPNHIRKIIYVWAIIIIIVLILALASTSNNQYLNKYSGIETALNEAALKYVKDNKIIPNEENKLRLDINVLKDFGYTNDHVIEDTTCGGFSLVYFKEDANDYVVNTYLKCKNYTTKGYSDYK